MVFLWFSYGFCGSNPLYLKIRRSSLPSADGPDADFPVPEPWIDDAEHRGMEQAQDFPGWLGKAWETMGKPRENHGKTIGKWWFNGMENGGLMGWKMGLDLKMLG